MNTMQLIFTTPAAKDINIKMSTQTDSPINGEISQIYKIDQETVDAIEKTVINDTKTELPASKNNVLAEENLDAKTNGNTNCMLENTIEENDFTESLNSYVSNNISTKTDSAQDTNELESKSQNLEMTNAEVAVNNIVDLKQKNNSNNSECLTSLEIKSDLANTLKPLCENNKILLENITAISASVSINEPAISLESDISNADDFTMDEETKETKKPSEDDCDSKTDKLNSETNGSKLFATDSTYSDDVSDQENKEVPQESADIVTNSKPNILINEEVTDSVLLLDDEDVTMQQVNGISADENLILPETKDLNPTTIDQEVLSPIQTNKTVKSTESLELVEMEDECLSLRSDENLASTVVSPIQIDEEISSVVQTCEEVISSKVNTLKHIEIFEVKLQSNVNSDQCPGIDNVTMSDLETTSENIVVSNIDQLKEDSCEISNNQETDVFPCDSKPVGDEKNKDSDSMGIDDNVKKVNAVKDNLAGMPNNIDTTLNEVLSKNTIIEDATRLEITSEIAVEKKLTENIVLRKDLECIKGKDKTESEESSTKILEKEPNKIIFTTENQENGETPKASVENSSVSEKNKEEVVKDLVSEYQENIEIIDEDDVNIIDIDEEKTKVQSNEKSPERPESTTLPVVCKLSNTLDILSDDEEEGSNVVANEQSESRPEQKQCINLDDDDDIMLIEEDSNSKDKTEGLKTKAEVELNPSKEIDVETGETRAIENLDLTHKVNAKDSSPENISSMELDSVPETEDKSGTEDKLKEPKKLLPENFLKTAKKNLAGMSRHELEDFCILRIVESIVDRSNLSEIKTKMKTMAVSLEDFKKRTVMMTKQNRDLQVVLKSVQEEQKKKINAPIQPLKITRSVGMQVLLNDKLDPRRKVAIPNPGQATVVPTGRPVKAAQSVKQIKPPPTPPSIPVPRKVPVNNSPAKVIINTPTNNVGNKSVSPHPNGLRNPSPVQKAPEKRTHSRMQANSVTVDLTDDEPPTKVASTKSSPSHPVRVVAPQNLLAQQRQFPPLNNNARKVYIPISGTQAQQIRSGQAIMMKNVVNPVPKVGPRVPMARAQQSSIWSKPTTGRHPAPLPESMKQYTPPTWKALPPAPDLKLSKVENGIVISWKIEGFSESSYETIASYQLYAYQETTSPPCTALWKKIGDVKALPLPMACTLTQFMAGFKYYFAVRAVDVRSRLGPFSLPGSILLLNKV